MAPGYQLVVKTSCSLLGVQIFTSCRLQRHERHERDNKHDSCMTNMPEIGKSGYSGIEEFIKELVAAKAGRTLADPTRLDRLKLVLLHRKRQCAWS